MDHDEMNIPESRGTFMDPEEQQRRIGELMELDVGGWLRIVVGVSFIVLGIGAAAYLSGLAPLPEDYPWLHTVAQSIGVLVLTAIGLRIAFMS